MIRTVFDYYSYVFKEEEGIVIAYFQTKSGTGYRVYFYPARDYFDSIPENI